MDTDSEEVGMTFRGTEDGIFSKDMRDNISASVLGASIQIYKALAFFNKNKNKYGNNFLYGHSKGGDLAMEVFVRNYENIKQIHVINAQPINDSNLSIEFYRGIKIEQPLKILIIQ